MDTTLLFWKCRCAPPLLDLHSINEPRCSWCLSRRTIEDVPINDVLLSAIPLGPGERSTLIALRDNRPARPARAKVRFLTGDDYPHLCQDCRATISAIAASIFDGDQADTDDNEAPAMYVYDNKMYCGGHECVNKPGEAAHDEECNCRSCQTLFARLGLTSLCDQCQQHITDCRCHFRIGPIPRCDCEQCQRIRRAELRLT